MNFLQWIKKLFFKPVPTGAKLQPTDSRDYKYEEHFVAGSSSESLIPSYTLWGYTPNQRSTESCVGWTIARMLQVLIYQETGVLYRASELFLWYNAKDEQGWSDKNTGVYPRDGFKRLFKDGFVPYDEMPFKGNLLRPPRNWSYLVADVAKDFLVRKKYKYYKVRKNDALSLVKKGQIVAVSLPVNKSFYFNKDGVVEHDRPSNYYHYMTMEDLVVIDGLTYIKCMNWWGKGYLYIPKQYFLDEAMDLWVLARRNNA